MPKRKKPRAPSASKLVKGRARALLGAPPPAKKFEDARHKPPKHKKAGVGEGAEFLNGGEA